MKKLILIIIIFLSLIEITNAQLTVDWKRTWGGSGDDYLRKLKLTDDGGFVAIGRANSSNGNFDNNKGEKDIAIMKFNNEGYFQWSKTYGGTEYDAGEGIEQTLDGGYIIAGNSTSDNWDITCSYYFGKVWISKLNESGDIEWSDCYSEDYPRTAKVNSIIQTNDSGFLAVGSRLAKSNDIPLVYKENFLVLKLNNNGDTIWSKDYGGLGEDVAYNVIQTKSNDFLVYGYTYSITGDITNFNGAVDAWILKLDTLGNIIWSKCYGGSQIEHIYNIIETNDSNFVVIGNSNSTNLYLDSTNGDSDLWVFKINQSGELLWSKLYGGPDTEYGGDITEASNGGYIVAGSRFVYGKSEKAKVWVLSIDSVGNKIWDEFYGGSRVDYAYSIKKISNGNYIVGANSNSDDGDVIMNHGANDFWILKLSTNTGINKVDNKSILLYPNPATSYINIEGKFKNGLIEMIDIYGHVVKTLSFSTNTIKLDLTDVKKGMYFMKIIEKKSISVKKVIIK